MSYNLVNVSGELGSDIKYRILYRTEKYPQFVEVNNVVHKRVTLGTRYRDHYDMDGAIISLAQMFPAIDYVYKNKLSIFGLLVMTDWDVINADEMIAVIGYLEPDYENFLTLKFA